MKKKLFAAGIVLMAALSTMTYAQDIRLPLPQQARKTMPVSEALATRHSVRDFSARELSLQDISDLCWAACGLSRDDDHRTAPTAMNRQEIRLFVFNSQGAYEYEPEGNVLKLASAGDHRRLVAGGKVFSQDFVLDAPVSLVIVIDFKKFGSHDEHAVMMTCVDAGNVSENINLFCQAAGFATVPRATMDVDGIRKLLGLTDKQLPIMNNPVGYSE